MNFLKDIVAICLNGILIVAIPSLEVVVDFADMLRIDIYECNPPNTFYLLLKLIKCKELKIYLQIALHFFINMIQY